MVEHWKNQEKNSFFTYISSLNLEREQSSRGAFIALFIDHGQGTIIKILAISEHLAYPNSGPQ